jgi:endonuclease YncB( thermonuclease family)
VPGGQPLSQEAKAFTSSELQGQEVGLEFDEDRTAPYGRLLAYVYDGGGMFNEVLLEGGYAQSLRRGPPASGYGACSFGDRPNSRTGATE